MDFLPQNNPQRWHIGKDFFIQQTTLFIADIYNYDSSNLVADEQDTGNKNRPDYKVDIYNAYHYAYSNVYGEIKPNKNITPTLLVNDFYRVAIFCKDAIDQFNLNNVIGFQVAGNSHLRERKKEKIVTT